MNIQFDSSTADRLIASANAAANEMRNQATSRRTAAENAAEDFSGAYARLFEAACGVEAEDRGRLAGVLEGLETQVGEAKQKAAEEKQRLADLSAWRQREAQRQRKRDANALLPGAPDLIPEPYDPKPSEVPVQAPELSAAFVARGRTRTPAASSGKSSADPEDLRNYVTQARALDGRLTEHLATVKNDWSSFLAACSWARLGTVTFITGFETLVAENEADSEWLERIAAAFELAGSGGIPNPSSPVGDAALGLAVDLLKRYRGSLIIPGGNAVIPSELINPRAVDAGWLKVFENGKWYSINPTTGFMSPTGSSGYHPLPSGMTKPNGWSYRPIILTDPKVGKPPAWAGWGARGLGVIGGGLTYWGAYSDSYNETLTVHPGWDEDQRQERAFQDSLIVGTVTVVGSILGSALAGAAVGSIVPGPGTAVGLVVGLVAGIVGGIIGGWAGQEAGEGIIDSIRGEQPVETVAPGPIDQPFLEESNLL